MDAVYTIGYEGASLDSWVDVLRDANVQVVVDVRDLPLSRRKGFSKTALGNRLTIEGIEYIHVRALGNPSEWRHALKDGSMTFQEFAPLFRQLLNDREEAVETMASLALKKRVCLVCFEKEADCCHRSIVAESLAASSPIPLAIRHL